MNRLFPDMDKASRKILGICYFAFFFSGIFSLMMGSLLPDIKAEYALSDGQSGLLLSGHSLGNLLAAITSGLVPLVLGKRKSMMVLSSLTIIGFAMMLLYGNPIWLVVAFVLTGIGRGSVSNFNNGTVGQLSGGSPAASNLLHGSFAVGALSAPLVFLLANNLGGWKAAVGIILLLGVFVVAGFSQMRFTEDRPNPQDKNQSSMAFLKNRSYLIWAGMMLCYLCGEYSINGWLVTFLQNKSSLLQVFDAAGEGLRTYSQTMASLFWALMLVGRLVCAALSAKIPQKQLLVVTSMGSVAFFALLLLGESLWLVTLSIAGLGLCLAGICPMIYSDATVITNQYPMGTSILLALASIGAILMPSVVGFTADAYGFTGAMGCILLAFVLLLVLAICNLLLPVEKMER